MRHLEREFFALEGASKLWSEAGHLSGVVEKDLTGVGLMKSRQ